ncbi:MAG: ankyrin repeat domain-containing protein, partial [Pseudomonadota bacterium]
LDYGADVNAKGEHGFTPLHEAAVQGHAKLVKHLLSVGADPLAKSDWGETAFEAASNLEDEACQDVLEILGAATARRTSN